MSIWISITLACLLVAQYIYFCLMHRKNLIHYKTKIKFWQTNTLHSFSFCIENYFRNTEITNHIITLKDGQIQIQIGDDHDLIDVNMTDARADIHNALQEAYSKFLNKVH